MSMHRIVARPPAAALAAAILGATFSAAAADTSAAGQTASPAPHHAHHRHHRVAARQPAPVQPAVPTPVASNTTPAPVPNDAVSPPDAPTPHTEVGPSVFQLHYPPVGEGYVTGSSSQAMDDREAAKATGVQATIPLKQ